ncbi:AbrB/MazE/SpoVT family DNA-binding domain-containing protein [Alterisphingorhabdus coralli]|uniref:AbrB/MazE/SpoVT family DNA-binding domain-containing protein n=1 Tax=Alterisphingorhabdus coralli TaxID=3071408 RepID=A0AA97F4P8_9SPHN|nr:AbrB/MazE/SpoVT family DNA-binding domain-containing protein [Parasphingorhabdus sp. SCSIO 66989]WOE74186.1 AbrB/MazE/SpoVT family DNA-binding domain-containing protein [Parasphingorhabdus sp. SCSIO 66989]
MMGIQLGRWGRSLALRLPMALVEKYGLKEGDEIDNAVFEEMLQKQREDRRKQAIENIRKMRIELPPDYKFDREEANAR